MDIKLVKNNGETRIVDVNGVEVGAGFEVIAGPCTVESEEQTIEAAVGVKKAGASLLRGGAFKPRSSPYAFQGLGEEGLKILAKAREETGLPVVTEVMDSLDIRLVESYADVLQVGSRNMHNFSLLKNVGKSRKPVLLKRGMSATIEEWLNAAEYIAVNGNPNIILCERGIRGFDQTTRNTLDVMAIPLAKKLSCLPVIGDPSHSTGVKDLVLPASKAIKAVGADGLIIEVHPEPEKALCDAKQQLNLVEFNSLMQALVGEKKEKALVAQVLVHDARRNQEKNRQA